MISGPFAFLECVDHDDEARFFRGIGADGWFPHEHGDHLKCGVGRILFCLDFGWIIELLGGLIEFAAKRDIHGIITGRGVGPKLPDLFEQGIDRTSAFIEVR